MKILADATLPKVTYNDFFNYTQYSNNKELQTQLKSCDILICRSTLKITEELLSNTKLQCIATASSGTDHIDHQLLKKHNITLFDAKGVNARAVADYIMACIAALRRQKYDLTGKAGIIGMGCVGTEIYKRLTQAGFNVYGYDPFKQEHDLLRELQQCSTIFVHANLHNTQPFPSYNLINNVFLKSSHAKIIINASRGGIVDEEHLLTHPEIIYCTDVYNNEPNIDPRIIEKATICTPHIAGHSIEAKYNTMVQLSKKIHQQYNITQPLDSVCNTSNTQEIIYSNAWEEQMLNIYDPMLETSKLKQATDKQQAFLALRQAHMHRHESIVSLK